MNAKAIPIVLMAIPLAIFSPMTASTQSAKVPALPKAQAKKAAEPDHAMDMPHGPQHVLAMAYCQNMATFSKALHDQAAVATSLDADFTTSAVAELRRSYDQMKQHHQAHMKMMSAEMQAQMSPMVQEMETHQTLLNDLLVSLELDAQSATPDPKKISDLTDRISSHLDAIMTMKAKAE